MKNSRFLPALALHHASGKSIRDSAKEANCAEKTAYMLAATAEFKDEVARLRTQFVDTAVAVLSTSATKAANALVKLLDSSDEKVVLASATKLLAMLGPLQEHHELRARIDQIESQGGGLRVAR